MEDHVGRIQVDGNGKCPEASGTHGASSDGLGEGVSHIGLYPQQEDAHLVKLEAFLDLFLAGLAESVADPIRGLYRAWNGQGLEQLSPEMWACWMKNLPDIRKHSEDWTKRLLNQQDLCSNLVNFARSQL